VVPEVRAWGDDVRRHLIDRLMFSSPGSARDETPKLLDDFHRSSCDGSSLGVGLLPISRRCGQRARHRIQPLLPMKARTFRAASVLDSWRCLPGPATPTGLRMHYIFTHARTRCSRSHMRVSSSLYARPRQQSAQLTPRTREIRDQRLFPQLLSQRQRLPQYPKAIPHPARLAFLLDAGRPLHSYSVRQHTGQAIGCSALRIQQLSVSPGGCNLTFRLLDN
jgi:hypothetical protein